MPLFLLKILQFFQKYWWICLLVIGSLVILHLFNQVADLSQVLNETQKIHSTEIDAIKKATEEREKATLENLQKMQDRLDQIEADYTIAKKKLDDDKKSQIKTIVEQTKNDPSSLAQQLSSATGFHVISTN